MGVSGADVCSLKISFNINEIDAKINVHAAVAMIIDSMTVNVEGLPTFNIGGGVGPSWKTAKGSMNEIHQILASRLVEEYKNQKDINVIIADECQFLTPAQIDDLRTIVDEINVLTARMTWQEIVEEGE